MSAINENNFTKGHFHIANFYLCGALYVVVVLNVVLWFHVLAKFIVPSSMLWYISADELHFK